MKNIAKLLAIVLLLSSCASGYNLIRPDRMNYQTNLSNQDIEFSYKYGVLNERGNKKYAKKESAKDTRVVAVKKTNNSAQPFVFGEDLKIHSNGSPVNLLEPKHIHQNLKQGVPIYLLYLLLTPMQLYPASSADDSSDEGIPIGLALGPGITAGNMIGAGSANSNFLKELESNFLNGRTIDAGETVYGLIGLYDAAFSPLTLE